MIPRSLSDVAGVVDGRLDGEDRTVSGAAADSREIHHGDLFVALKGERADGHAFVADAFGRGAAGALVGDDGVYDGPVIRVAATGDALLALAADERRRRRDVPVVGITGSTGKTSVKDLTAAVLAMRLRVAASPRSFNTEVGVPLAILGADPEAEVLVCEMGSRGRGHIALVAGVAAPRVGVVTNVGVAHMELFGSAETIADSKAELVEALPEDGTAVLNADDPVVRDFADRTRARSLLYGTSADAEIRGEDLALDDLGRPAFTLATADGRERVQLAVAGEHMASNALAAAACGVALGLSAGECAAGLKDARLSPWRMEVLDAPGGYRVVNDAYNANPASVVAALRTARWMAREGRCLAVLGEMAELGPISREQHEWIGEQVARMGIHALITVGDTARLVAVAAAREGVEPDRVRTCDTTEDAITAVRELVRPGDVVLVKGSRVARLERVVEGLIA